MQTSQTHDGDGWRTLDCRFDGGNAAAAAIGLIALPNDMVIEPELRRFPPVPGVEVFSTRIRMARDLSPASLEAMAEDLPRAVGLLLPDDRLDVVAFGCTSGALIIGPQRVATLVASVRPGIAVTDPVSASLAAFQALGVRRLALLTPYPDSVNAIVERSIRDHGFDVPQRATFRQASDVTIGRIEPRDILQAAIAIGQRDVEAVFLCCTALRCSTIIETIEIAIGKPVVTSNQALAWHALRRVGRDAVVPGMGRLFRLQGRGD
jgi:maleate isomerase